MLGDSDVIQSELRPDHLLRRSTLVLLQRECRRLSEASQPSRLVERALASNELDVFSAKALEELGSEHRRQRASKPLVTQTTDPDCEVKAIEHHGCDHAGSQDPVGGVGRYARRSHRQAQKEVVARPQVFECPLDLRWRTSLPLPQWFEHLTPAQEGRLRAAAVKLLSHV